MFKFIHAADIHLDSPLCGLDNYEGAPVEAIRGATRKAFSNLVRLAITERVDFVILAGDIYDGDWQDYNTGLFFVKELRELEKAGIPVVMLSGNHDAQSRITKHLTLPDNTRCFPTDKPDTVVFDHLRVAVHGQGFANQAETRDLAADYPSPRTGYFNIGVLHTALDGREEHASYAPCTLAELLALGYEYWALGHVHQRESVNGSERIRVEYPGNVQGRHIRETGAKGCLLVTVDNRQQAKPEFRALDVFRWEKLNVDAAEIASMSEALDAAVKAIADSQDQSERRALAVRVEISCRDMVYHQIAGSMEQFRFDLASQAGSDIWIEKIKLRLVGKEQRVESLVTGDAASELRAVLAELRLDALAAQGVFASEDCGKLKKVLPSELRNVFVDDHNDIFDLAEMLLRGDGNAEEAT